MVEENLKIDKLENHLFYSNLSLEEKKKIKA